MDPRTLEQLLAIARTERLDDTAFPPRWSDAMLARALSEGEREAARTAKLLLDGTSRQTLVPLVDGQAIYRLPAAFFEVNKVRYEDTGERLVEVAIDALERQDPQWRASTSSRPRYYVLATLPGDQLQLTLTASPTDIDAGLALRLEGYRTPLYELSMLSDEPEIGPHYHEALVEWACYRADQVRHPDLYDPVRAADHLANFRSVFGPAIDAHQRRAQRERRSHTTTAREV
jgi:hypothetical protein